MPCHLELDLLYFGTLVIDFQIPMNQHYFICIFVKKRIFFVIGGADVDYCHKFFKKDYTNALGSIKRAFKFCPPVLFLFSCYTAWRIVDNKIKSLSPLEGESLSTVVKENRRSNYIVYCQVVVSGRKKTTL